jgi:hypothetical protein
MHREEFQVDEQGAAADVKIRAEQNGLAGKKVGSKFSLALCSEK